MSHECSFPNCEMMKDILNSTKDGWYIRSLVPSTSNFQKTEPISERSNIEEWPKKAPKKKEWQHHLSADHRELLTYKIVNSIFSMNDLEVMRDKRLLNIVAYAQRVEHYIYEKANSRSQYYNLLADKIHRLQSGLKEKRQHRLKLQQEQQLQTQMANKPKDDSIMPKDEQCHAIDVPCKTKDWHNSMTKKLRNHFVYTLVQALLPIPQSTSNPISMSDTRMKDFISYARTVECDFYTMAESKSEYYRLVTEVMVKVQVDLESALKIR